MDVLNDALMLHNDRQGLRNARFADVGNGNAVYVDGETSVH